MTISSKSGCTIMKVSIDLMPARLRTSSLETWKNRLIFRILLREVWSALWGAGSRAAQKKEKKGGLVKNLKPFHLFLGCAPNLGFISSLVYPNLGGGLDSSAVLFLPELKKSSISSLDSDIKIAVNQ